MYRPVVNVLARSIAYLLAVGIVNFLFLASAVSHELQPSVADLKVKGSTATLQIRTNLEALIAQVSPEHDNTNESENAEAYDALRSLAPQDLETAFDAFRQTFEEGLTLQADGTTIPLQIDTLEISPVGDIDLPRSSRITLVVPDLQSAKALTFSWSNAFGPIVLRALNDQGEGYATMLSSGEMTEPIEIAKIRSQTFWQTVMVFVPDGYLHVLGLDAIETVTLFETTFPMPMGLDHILFAIAIFLLAARVGPIFWQIAAITIAHAVTLALAVLGYVTIPPEIIEPLIAACIVYVSLENLVTNRLTAWRPLVVFGFGLLHGLGFAGALQAFSVSEAQFIPSLLGFNIGVELGQLTVIAICLVLVGFWFGSRSWYRYVVTIPGSLIIAGIGAYWFYERTML